MLQRISLSLIMATVYLSSLSLIQASTTAFNLIENITEKDISDSVKRVKELTLGNYEGTTPIFQGQSRIGGMRLQGNDITISFRGAFGADYMNELTSCINGAKPQPIADLGLMGVYGKFASSFNATKKSISEWIIDRLLNHDKDLASTRILVEGYSMGSGIAPLMALHLRKSIIELGIVQDPHIGVLTYAPMNIFTKETAESYSSMMLATNHLNFVAEKDVVCTIFDPQDISENIPKTLNFFRNTLMQMTGVPYQPAGTSLRFSPNASEAYTQRVTQLAYTYLSDNLFAKMAVAATIPVDYWEAHMPETYEELAPKTFSDFKTTLNPTKS